MFERLRAGLDVDAEHLALETIREEGPGGIFLARRHTLEHFREWVFMSPLFRSQAYPTWDEAGRGRDARGGDRPSGRSCSRATRIPGIDDGVDAELQEFMAERKRELDE